MPLLKPQMPPVPPMPKGWDAVKSLHGHARGQTVYLQGYLRDVYGALIPWTINPTLVGNNLSPYTVSAQDVLIAAAAGAASDTVILLPVATGSGRSLIIARTTDNSTHNVVVQASGTDLINGAATYTLSAQYGATAITDALPQGNWIIWSKI